jgi:anti-sigma regulatory factor (Ser/Thr protein kinase)
MLSGVAEAVGLDGVDLNDIRTAVTEACNNVVLHAYDGEEGPLEIEVRLAARTLEVIVRDRGVGIDRHTELEDPAQAGIGLRVIKALVQRVEFRDLAGGGTEVWMDFATPSAHPLEPLGEDAETAPTAPPDALASTTTIAIAPAGLARNVLPRLLRVLAARAYFTTDRISDALLIADALGTHLPGAVSAGHLDIAVRVEPRNLELRIGPLDAGRWQPLLDESGPKDLGAVIERLADDHSVAAAGTHEELTLHLLDRR